MVGVDEEGAPNEVIVPFVGRSDDGKHLLVMDGVVLLRCIELLGVKCNWPRRLPSLADAEHSTGSQVTGIGGQVDVAWRVMLDGGKPIAAESNLLDSVKGCLVLRCPSREGAVVLLLGERSQDSSLVGEMRQEVGDIAYQPKECPDILGAGRLRPVSDGR